MRLPEHQEVLWTRKIGKVSIGLLDCVCYFTLEKNLTPVFEIHGDTTVPEGVELYIDLN